MTLVVLYVTFLSGLVTGSLTTEALGPMNYDVQQVDPATEVGP